MRIAITGGTGFVGRHLAGQLARDGHEVVVIARGARSDADGALRQAGVHIVRAGVTHVGALSEAFAGCDAVAHCAGINREIGRQTYRSVHIEGTRAVVAAARSAGVGRIVMLSFLRARPDGPTAYHRSKWTAKHIVRTSGLDFTIVKAGVMYGHGDHMLEHLSRAFHTFPIFALVGLRDRPVRPLAIQDAVRVLAAACVGDPRLRNETIALAGPEELPLAVAVRRVAAACNRRPVFVPIPVVGHLLIAWIAEKTMKVPLLSVAQAHILAEGVVAPLPFGSEPPFDLRPVVPFSVESIRAGLPEPGGFTRRDLRWGGQG